MWYRKFSIIKFHNLEPNFVSFILRSKPPSKLPSMEFLSNNCKNSITFISFSLVRVPWRVKLYFSPFSSSNSILIFLLAVDRSGHDITSHLTLKVINKLTKSSAFVSSLSVLDFGCIFFCSYRFSPLPCTNIFQWK